MARIDQSQPQDSEALTEYMSKAFNLSPAHVLSNVSYNSNEQLVSFAKAGSLRKASPMGAEEGAAAEHAQNQYTPQQWSKMSGADKQGAAREMSAGSKQSSLRASFQKTPPEGMEAEASGAARPDTQRMSATERRAYIRQQNAERLAAERAAEPDPAKRYPGIKAPSRSRTLDSGLRAPADTGAFPDVSAAEGGPVGRRPNLDQIEGSSGFNRSFQKTPPEGMEGEASGAARPDTRRMSEAERRAYIRQQNAERTAAERAAEPDPAKRYPGIRPPGRNKQLDAGLRGAADTGAFPDVSAAEGGPVGRRPNLDQIEGSSGLNLSLARQSFSMKNFAKSVNALEMISEKMIKDFGGR